MTLGSICVLYRYLNCFGWSFFQKASHHGSSTAFWLFGLQIGQIPNCRAYLYALRPKVGISYVLGVLELVPWIVEHSDFVLHIGRMNVCICIQKGTEDGGGHGFQGLMGHRTSRLPSP